MGHKIGLVLEGGGMRGIYTSGVLDYLLEQGIHFDYVIGVSAGAGNALNFVSRQVGRTKKVIKHENAPSYYGLMPILKERQILGLDTFIRQYAEKYIPYDFDAFYGSETELEEVVVNCETGKAEYRGGLKERDEFYAFSMASCAVPFICKPVEFGGYHYLDGSIVDSIPVKRAVEKGCDKVVIVLTKPEGEGPTDYGKYQFFINWFYKKYPKLSQALVDRYQEYQEQKEYMDQLVADGKALIIRPKVQMVKHFEGDQNKLNACYQMAYDSMASHFDELREFIKI